MIQNEKWFVNTDLHTTIALPGGCNARCKFCYGLNRTEYKGDYVKDLDNLLHDIPDNVHKLALTGMEPTLSPYIEQVLEMIAQPYYQEQFHFKFLNTNGYNLKKLAPLVNKSLDAVNISRHAADDKKNVEIFGSPTVPDTESLKEIISLLMVPVNINYVMAEGLSNEEIQQQLDEMVNFCKRIGAEMLTIRFQATDLLRKEPLPECLKSIPTVKQHGNPGCTYWHKNYNDFPVIIRYTTIDPSHNTNWDYGFIIQTDLRVTRDWEGIKIREKVDGKYV